MDRAGAAERNETNVGDSVEVDATTGATMQPPSANEQSAAGQRAAQQPRRHHHNLKVQTSTDALDSNPNNDTEPLLVAGTPSSHSKLSRSGSMVSWELAQQSSKSDIEASAGVIDCCPHGSEQFPGGKSPARICCNDLRMKTSQITVERAELRTVCDVMMHGPPQAVARLLQVAALGMQAHYIAKASNFGGSEEAVIIDKESVYMEELSSQFLKEWLASKVMKLRRTVPFIFSTKHERHNFSHCNPGVGDTSHISEKSAEPRSVVDALAKSNRLLQQILVCSDKSKAHDSIEACEKRSVEARANKARRYFEDFDADGDGYLSKFDLEAFVSCTGREFKSAKKLAQCFDLLDGNDDGRVSMEEFVSWWSINQDKFTLKTCTYSAQRYSFCLRYVYNLSEQQTFCLEQVA